MTLATISIDADRVTFRCSEAGIDEPPRTLAPGDGTLFERWATDYRRALDQDRPELLLALGREMYLWLDVGERWMERARSHALPPFLLEIAGPLRPSGTSLDFLEAPWELLADKDDHLAARPELVFSPVRRLGVPQQPADPSPYAVSLIFMAAAPDGVAPLFYEEEEAAILHATGETGVDLLVEESGTLPRLAECLGREGQPDVLHLSCHGLSASPERASSLLFEDDLGHRAPATAEQVAAGLGSSNLPKRLLFVSACLTAAPDALLGSFALTLIQRGCPAALGWSGSVKDAEATRFAASLYRRLCQLREPLEAAVARARHDLLTPEPGAIAAPRSRDWHLARLFLGPTGGGVFVAPRARRPQRVALDRGQREFLDPATRAVPVANRYEFVGRRREIKEILRAPQPPDRKDGVLIHGFGHHGKSSLACRIAQRLRDHTLVGVFKHYDASDILAAIDGVLCMDDVSKRIARHADVRQSPSKLRIVLREILEGPCQQLERNAAGEVLRRPIVLVIDDIERILAPSPSGLHQVKHENIAALRAVIEAFHGADTDSRLLLTSRHAFTLPSDGGELTSCLLQVPLGPMSEIESLKQARAKERVRGESADPKRTARCIAAARGNPGLQDLLFVSALEAPDACDRALEAMERYLAGGEADEDKVRTFLEKLGVDALIDQLTEGEKKLLQASTLFEVPVPLPVLAQLGEAIGIPRQKAQGERLLAFGLWDLAADLVKTDQRAAQINPLVRPRVAEQLSKEDGVALAGVVLGPLFDRWGGVQGERPPVVDLELARLGLLAGDAAVLSAVAARAVHWLYARERFRDAASLGKRSVQALDKGGREPPVGLFRMTSEACQLVADMPDARAMIARALEIARRTGGAGQELEANDLPALLLTQARLLVHDGDPDAALPVLQEALSLLAGDAFKRGRAVTLGDIARIRRNKGEVDKALSLHEQELGVYEELGDRRSRAVTLGDIAHILVDKGQVDKALSLHEQALGVYEELGDRRSRAVTLGDIARIRRNKGEVDKALSLHEQELGVYEELGDRRSRAVTLGGIARILVDKGEVDKALSLHEERLGVYEELGARRERAVTLGDIARIRRNKGEVDKALSLHEDALGVYEELGARRERAVTLGDIAHILVSKGKVEKALSLHEERLRVVEELGDMDGIANAHWSIGEIDLQQGRHPSALEHLAQSYAMLNRIGRLDGICVVGETLGWLLLRAGMTEEGRAILERSRAGFERLGQRHNAQQVQRLLDASSNPPPTSADS